MKASVYTEYGSPDVVQLDEVDTPTVGENELLIEVHSTTVTSGDYRARTLDVPRGFGLISRVIFGVFRPKNPILGTELAGEITAIGIGVSEFDVGDHVFAFSGVDMGCHAEYKIMPADGAVARKPDTLSFDEAAALSFGGTTALYFLQKGNLEGGESVLINGASGAVGTAAVQLCKHFGANVTGVCSTANLELVLSLGADRVLDYTAEDFTELDDRYDVIVDTVGTAPVSGCIDSLNEGGRLLLVAGGLPDMLKIPWVGLTSSKRVIAGQATGGAEELSFLAELAAAGEFKPVIDRRYPFDEIAEAHRHVDTGHKTGNVVVTVK